MKASKPTRSLNNAFKRFQRLPELPKMELGENRSAQAFVEARSLGSDGKTADAENQERFTKVLIG